jgi:hypothetical protein
MQNRQAAATFFARCVFRSKWATDSASKWAADSASKWATHSGAMWVQFSGTSGTVDSVTGMVAQ